MAYTQEHAPSVSLFHGDKAIELLPEPDACCAAYLTVEQARELAARLIEVANELEQLLKNKGD